MGLCVVWYGYVSWSGVRSGEVELGVVEWVYVWWIGVKCDGAKVSFNGVELGVVDRGRCIGWMGE